MEKRAVIITELDEMGSTLARTPPVTPYSAPPGYFESLPGVMCAVVSDSEPGLTIENRLPAFSVPEGYFQHLPQLLLQKVREGDLPEQSAQEEISALSPLLKGVTRKMPNSIPERYFDELIHNPVDGESDLLPATLEKIRTRITYTVPDNYFERFPESMLKLVKPDHSGKVYRGMFGKTILRYAAAAVIAGIAITSGFFILRPSSNQPVVSSAGLQEKASETSDEDIINYLENQSLPIPADLQMVTANADIKDDAILEMLADVTDEELQQYLQAQTGSKQLIN